MLQDKRAFTMLEAIMVIVVMGIIAAVAIPRLENDSMQEASDQILSDIRYTQHLALTDDVTNPNNPNWQRAFWTIDFTPCGGTNQAYTIYSDKNYNGTIDRNEVAIDSLGGLPLDGSASCNDNTASQKVFITDKYGISSVAFGSSCAGNSYIGFDRLGRLHQGFRSSTSPNYASRLAGVCTITFSHPNGNFTIQINPETGYAFRTDQQNM